MSKESKFRRKKNSFSLKGHNVRQAFNAISAKIVGIIFYSGWLCHCHTSSQRR